MWGIDSRRINAFFMNLFTNKAEQKSNNTRSIKEKY